MPTKTLIKKDGKRYGGKYVATRSFKDTEVICSGADPKIVFDRAVKKGITDPVIFFVPKRGMIHIY